MENSPKTIKSPDINSNDVSIDLIKENKKDSISKPVVKVQPAQISSTTNNNNINAIPDTDDKKKVETRKPKEFNKKTTLNTTASGEQSVLTLIKKHNKDSEDKEMIDLSLQKHFFLKVLEKNARNEIVKEMSLFKVDKGATLFEQNSNGNYFYIVKEGELKLSINNIHLKNFCKGDSFGELALLHNSPRSGTVIAETETKLWCMERKNFRKIIDHINGLNHKDNKKYIASIPFLSKYKLNYNIDQLDNDQKTILSQNLLKEYFEKDSYIVKSKLI